MKLAIVHDFFTRIGGAEQVLCALNRIWPEAPIYLLVADHALVRRYLPNATVRLSPLGRLPLARRWYRAAAWALPAAVESLDLRGFDTVLSNTVLAAHGAIVRPGTRHLSYCYSPPRMLWDRAADYERRGPLAVLTRHALRTWDGAASQRPDRVLAISRTTAARIATYWHRDAMVLNPPLRTLPATPAEAGDYYLAVGRLLPHKNLDLIMDAAAKMGVRLVIAGEGPLTARLARRGAPTTTFTGAVSDERLAALYRGARAVIVANDEDWGLTAVEAMSVGTPVLALRRGGATETVLEGVTGEFFDDPIPEALADGMRRLAEHGPYDRERIRRHASQWSEETWAGIMRGIVQQ